jgi:hypothetical protein
MSCARGVWRCPGNVRFPHVFDACPFCINQKHLFKPGFWRPDIVGSGLRSAEASNLPALAPWGYAQSSVFWKSGCMCLLYTRQTKETKNQVVRRMDHGGFKNRSEAIGIVWGDFPGLWVKRPDWARTVELYRVRRSVHPTTTAGTRRYRGFGLRSVGRSCRGGRSGWRRSARRAAPPSSRRGGRGLFAKARPAWAYRTCP